MSGPTRSTAAGQAYLDLQITARASKRPTDELHQLYALECLLDRLPLPAGGKVHTQGRVLLGAYAMRRPTGDVDLRAEALATDPDTVRTIAAVPVDDGITLDTAGTRAEAIREDDVYQRVRVTMTTHLATARLVFHVNASPPTAASPSNPSPLTWTATPRSPRTGEPRGSANNAWTTGSPAPSPTSWTPSWPSPTPP